MTKKKTKITELTKSLMAEKNITDVADLQSVLKEMLKSGVETLLEAELDEQLGYDKYSRDGDSSNYRNGKSNKRVRTDLGELNLEIPRDRNGDFEPQIVPKNSSDLSAIEDKVISMYGKGMSQRDISAHIEDIYGMPLSAQSISRMTDKIIPMIEEWQHRPLESKYPFIFMDAIHYKVKHNNRIVSKAAYVVVGINMDGKKDVLGIWIGENETSKFWLKVLTDLKNRGVQEVTIFSVDGLPGFEQAIKATYPTSVVQRCIIHQIRYSTRFVNYKDKKELMIDLKAVYQSPNEESAYEMLVEFEEKWGSKYPSCVKSWKDNWHVLSPFFSYSENIRRIMYTTNIIENLNRQYRKVTKGKPVFPTDTSLVKALYLATENAAKKWTQRQRNWDLIVNELSIIHS
ncbi:IS256 family transposase [Wansuia hejianensis]|uniref:Mutator family transposase n=1 Tax=Wansuia hejianensis TaxID=2763667 RepID=A0A926EWT7_9FIRM|nr:IS256 family transposase [Wansuia hejianensis]MBC8589940.1 IS256 family transposase [Wansuia hejianensis]